MLSGDTLVAAEIKLRERALEFFEKYPPLLERTKLDGLEAERLRLKDKGREVELFYFNFCKDGAVQVFQLKSAACYTWRWKRLPKDKFNPTVKVWILVTELDGAAYHTFFIY